MQDEFAYFPQNDTAGINPSAPLQSETNGHAKGYALASLWLGIASLFCTCCCCCLYPLAPIVSIISIVMACLSRRDNNKIMKGAAIGGLIMAILGLVLFFLICIYEIYMLTMAENQMRDLIREVLENNTGMTFEEFIEAVRASELE